MDVDLEENVPVAVSVVDLQHRRVPRRLRAVVDVSDLLLRQLLQLESGERPVAVQPSQPAVARRLEDHDQDVGWVVWVFDLQDRLGDGRLVAGAVHGQRREGHDPGRLQTIDIKKRLRD